MIDLNTAREMYESGASLLEIATEQGTCKNRLAEALRAEGVEIRQRGGFEVTDLPRPRLCVHGCGRPATSIQSQTCLSCALHPPCGCKDRHKPDRRYWGQWACRGCGLLGRGR